MKKVESSKLVTALEKMKEMKAVDEGSNEIRNRAVVLVFKKGMLSISSLRENKVGCASRNVFCTLSAYTKVVSYLPDSDVTDEEFVIDFNVLYGFLVSEFQGFKGKVVEFRRKGSDIVSMSCDTESVDFADFPETNAVETINGFKNREIIQKVYLGKKDWRRVRDSLYACGKNDVRLFLNGICFFMKKDNVSVVSSDGARLIRNDLGKGKLTVFEHQDDRFILNYQDAKRIERFLKEHDSFRVSFFEDKRIVFYTDGERYMAECIDHPTGLAPNQEERYQQNYPSFERAMEKDDFGVPVKMPKDFLKGRMKGAMVHFEGKRGEPVEIKVKHDDAVVKEVVVDMVLEDDVSACFDYGYLSDLSKGKEVCFSISQQNKRLEMFDSGRVELLMEIRLQ